MKDCSACGATVDPDIVRCSECHKVFVEAFEQQARECYDRFEVPSETLKPATFQEKVRLVYPRLESLASREQTAGYLDIAGDGVFSAWLKYLLGTIGWIEHHDDRPLLPSVIVNSGRDFPGDGYFQLVERLDGYPSGITTWGETEQRRWWEEQLSSVYNYWDNE